MSNSLSNLPRLATLRHILAIRSALRITEANAAFNRYFDALPTFKGKVRIAFNMETRSSGIEIIEGLKGTRFERMSLLAEGRLFAKRVNNLGVLFQRLPLPACYDKSLMEVLALKVSLIVSFWAQQYVKDRKVFSQVLFSTFCAYFGELREMEKILFAIEILKRVLNRKIAGGKIGFRSTGLWISITREEYLKGSFRKFLRIVEPNLDLPPTGNFLDYCAGLMSLHTSPLQTVSERGDDQRRRKLAVFANLRRLLETVTNPDKLAGQSTYLSRQYLVDEWHLSDTDPDHPFYKIEGIEERWSDVEQIFKYLSTGIHEYESIDGSLGLREGDFKKEDEMILKDVFELLKQRLNEGTLKDSGEQSEAVRQLSRKRRERESELAEHGWLPMGPKRRCISDR